LVVGVLTGASAFEPHLSYKIPVYCLVLLNNKKV